VSVFYRYSLLSLILIVAPVALGASVTGAGEVSGADQGQGRDRGSAHDESADEMQKMNELRPDWQQIVGKTGSATVFRRWLAKQPKAYQRMIESASTAAELNESIEEFLASDEALVAAHLEELDVKLAEMRARAQEQGRHGDEGQRLK
jgi:hypothetical protein